ncbi:putative NBD/HSP70 family sugar kinase [Evansella vedderi]|uniref:NBD/HSP70 family sugar kinase n=1 Tax=Evansella vedderi TaxID=38282 RepID=A0ABT9ZZR8_9BACI|nr:ROK family transcriptional regulator [Evansella vedderi]MDQ0256739.1 putative NBD/HSP70 family sugar kinase [Evansella vedderi]
MITGDGAYIKKLNRSLLLEKIIEHGMISRAELSKLTGLNKATISVQINDLLDEELIYETRQEHHNIGRRPIMLSLNRKTGFVLGIDLDYKAITYTLSDLLGFPVYSNTFELTTSDYDVVVKELIKQIKDYDAKSSHTRYGLVGVVIGIHGTVGKDEVINFVPQHQWHNKKLKEDLQKELDINISIDNNANLVAFAEKVFQHHHTQNLLSLTMYSGIGTGLIMDGTIQKGFHGYAGEIGHMIIYPEGKQCKCGNKGCWELYASEAKLFEALSEKKKLPNVKYEDLEQWIDTGDPEAYELLEEFIKYISIGLNNVINLCNPETIVLNSNVLRIYPNVIEKIKGYLTSSVTQYGELVISQLGTKACVMGACAHASKNFLEISEISLELTEEKIPSTKVDTIV